VALGSGNAIHSGEADANPKVHGRLNDLIEECRRTPFKGTGKPEPLKGDSRAGGHAGLLARIVWFVG
jgi:hypothetical protein